MSGVGLQLLPMALHLGAAARSHSHALLHFPQRNSRLRVLRLGGDLVSFVWAASAVLGVSVSGPATRCSLVLHPQGRPGTVSVG